MSDRKEFRDLADPERAREVVASLDLSAGSERVALEDARGRVLAERVDAALDVPGFDRAAMDGYAVRAPDTYGASEARRASTASGGTASDAEPVTLPVVGSVHAGETPGVALDEGEAAEISTGAVMPEGADAVVIVERTEELTAPSGGEGADGEESDETDRRVRIETAVTPGENVMLAGADIAAGERALGPGTELTPREIGLLSALGVDEVPVRATPRVAIVSTGDELVRPGEDLDHRAGQIHDVNSYAVATAVEEAGGEPVVYPHVGDDTDAMEETLLDAAADCDLVLTSGSTSASAVDVVYRVIEDQGELLLHGVAIKPGKPMIVGRIGGDPGAGSDAGDGNDGAAYVGLPGYPVSALTIFRTFVAPAIRSSAGIPEPRTARVDGRMAVTERTEEGRRRLLAVGLVEDEAGETLVYPVDKGSGATTTLTAADGVVDVPADTNRLSAGEKVTVDLFSPDVRPPTLLGVGEDDPALSRLLDRLERPRYLARGSRGGLRELRDGLPDVAVVAGPFDADEEGIADAAELGGWSREWGLVVPDGNPEGVTGLADLVDRELSFVNRGTESGLRTSLSNALADLADGRGVDRRTVTESISGFDRAARAFESPARSVAAGDADAGLGLRATAAKLGLGFVPVGSQPVRVLANPDRLETASVRELDGLLADASPVLDGLDGFDRR
ncbi:molybdopterin biosynthesis protein [Halosimplex rubrum]|uniref:Molybdopterin biosynthesis protein n=1 Tax=Halosimplex rubrum TaxID=869889 RepID=A0A7D5P5U0_9EURY|nr:molybdopterin biosynthesis protein [Halosimplex rubrum]QLH79124.1 molybdopterin biosynthesis protein [Halosimplex rubrum]